MLHRFARLLAPLDTAGGSGGATAAPAAEPAVDAPATTQPTGADAQKWDRIDPKEFVGLRKELRQFVKLATDATKENDSLRKQIVALQQQQVQQHGKGKADAAPVDASADALAAQVAKLQAKLEAQDAERTFRDYLDETGISDPQQRKLLKRLYINEKPEDVSEWLMETLTLLGGKRSAPAAEVPKPAADTKEPKPKVDTGPAHASGVSLPEDPYSWPKEVVDRMSPAEVAAARAAWNAKKTQSLRNPYLGKRREDVAANPAEAAVAAFAKAMGQRK